MMDTRTDRRKFLKIMSAGAAGAVLANGKRAQAGPSEPFRIHEPFHGAVLNRRTGKEAEGGLSIAVRGEAPVRDQVTVNGKPAAQVGNSFVSEVLLREKETEIVAVTEGSTGRREHRVRVVWDKNSRPRYRFSIDDNSFFLRDVAKKKYASLFDCFYLKMLRDLHAKYKTKFVLNVYYATGDGFDLTKFPDRYKGEWKDNADWLRLAFHAHANDPDRPYQYAEPAKLDAWAQPLAAEPPAPWLEKQNIFEARTNSYWTCRIPGIADLETSEKAAAPAEQLTISIDDTPAGGTLKVSWGTTVASVPFTVG